MVYVDPRFAGMKNEPEKVVSEVHGYKRSKSETAKGRSATNPESPYSRELSDSPPNLGIV